jgi:hypothetical protein
VHELHYQMKARADGLHKNFGCYNFSMTGWTNEWFYVKAEEKKKGETHEHGDESIEIELRHDSTLVQYAVGVSLSVGRSGVQGRG